ncbi:hypothetical protein [Amycolatopsis sp. NPDC054798]
MAELPCESASFTATCPAIERLGGAGNCIVGVAVILLMKHGRKPAQGGLVEDATARVPVAQA